MPSNGTPTSVKSSASMNSVRVSVPNMLTSSRPVTTSIRHRPLKDWARPTRPPKPSTRSEPHSSPRHQRDVSWPTTTCLPPSDGERLPTIIKASMPCWVKGRMVTHWITSKSWCWRSTRPTSWQVVAILPLPWACSSATPSQEPSSVPTR